MPPERQMWQRQAAMQISGHLVLSIAFVLGFSPFVQAQQRAGRAASQSMPVTAPAASHLRTATGGVSVVRNSPSRRSTSRTNTATAFGSAFFGGVVTPQELLDPFPGFGFNFEHVNSIDRDLAVRAFIDPLTQIRLATAERLLRDSLFVGAPGAFLIDGGGAYVYPQGPWPPDADQPGSTPAPAPAQPQIIVVQGSGSQQPQQQSHADTDDSQHPSLPDVGEFTLVLRNGVEISAVAFTRVDDQIVYITPAGGRRTIAASEIDSDATQRTNQERGTPLQLTL